MDTVPSGRHSRGVRPVGPEGPLCRTHGVWAPAVVPAGPARRPRAVRASASPPSPAPAVGGRLGHTRSKKKGADL